MPLGIVGVLDGQLRQPGQGICLLLPEPGIQRGNLADQHTDRPAIRDDVVHAHEQHVFPVAKPDQHAPDQRAACQIESGLTRLPQGCLQGALLAFSCLLRQDSV